MLRTRWGVCLVAFALACGGGGGPTDVTVEFLGTYQGNHVFRIELTGGSADIPCPGTIIVSRADDGRLEGTLTINTCEFQGQVVEASTIPFTGTISGQGQILFTLTGQEQFVQAFAAQGCTVTRVDPGFAGTISGGRIDATFSFDLACTTFGNVVIRWRVDMTKR